MRIVWIVLWIVAAILAQIGFVFCMAFLELLGLGPIIHKVDWILMIAMHIALFVTIALHK